ncbi:hypothetical protein FQZ97_1120390 [compost metagenome]
MEKPGLFTQGWAEKECAMATTDKPVEIEKISCEICRKEVPLSEATVPEASDYFVHFCGLECYEAWKRRAEQTQEDATRPPP